MQCFSYRRFFASRDAIPSIRTQVERFGRFLCKILIPIFTKLGFKPPKIENFFQGRSPGPTGVWMVCMYMYISSIVLLILFQWLFCRYAWIKVYSKFCFSCHVCSVFLSFSLSPFISQITFHKFLYFALFADASRLCVPALLVCCHTQESMHNPPPVIPVRDNE